MVWIKTKEINARQTLDYELLTKSRSLWKCQRWRFSAENGEWSGWTASRELNNVTRSRSIHLQAGCIRWPCFPVRLWSCLESDFVRHSKASQMTPKSDRNSSFPLHSLTFTSLALCRYWTFFEADVVIDDNHGINESISHNSSENATISCHMRDVIFIKTYLVGVNGIVALNLPILLLLIFHSARGSITDTKARRFVPPLMYLKWALNCWLTSSSHLIVRVSLFRIFLMLPEIALNVMGTLWMYSSLIQCHNPIDTFANVSIEGEIPKVKRNRQLLKLKEINRPTFPLMFAFRHSIWLICQTQLTTVCGSFGEKVFCLLLWRKLYCRRDVKLKRSRLFRLSLQKQIAQGECSPHLQKFPPRPWRLIDQNLFAIFSVFDLLLDCAVFDQSRLHHRLGSIRWAHCDSLKCAVVNLTENHPTERCKAISERMRWERQLRPWWAHCHDAQKVDKTLAETVPAGVLLRRKRRVWRRSLHAERRALQPSLQRNRLGAFGYVE